MNQLKGIMFENSLSVNALNARKYKYDQERNETLSLTKKIEWE